MWVKLNTYFCLKLTYILYDHPIPKRYAGGIMCENREVYKVKTYSST